MRYKMIIRSILIAISLLISIDFYGQKKYWTGAGTTNNWTDPNNWSSNTLPNRSDSVFFDGRNNKNSFINNNFTIAKLVVNGYIGEISFLGIGKSLLIGNGGLITRTGRLTGSLSNSFEIKGTVDVDPQTTFDSNGGTLNAPTARTETNGCDFQEECPGYTIPCNYVKNYSFESYLTDPPGLIVVGCPDNIDVYSFDSRSYPITKACGWFGLFTPDYYNFGSDANGHILTDYSGYSQGIVTIPPPSATDVPKTGNGMAGFYGYIWKNPDGGTVAQETDVRETIYQFLGANKLLANKSYYISINAKLSSFSKYSINGLGFLFTNKLLDYNLGSDIAATSYLPAVIRTNDPTTATTDNVGTTWTEIKNTRYKPDADKTYMYIGVFGLTGTIGPKAINTATTAVQGAYYYIDDIEIVPYPDLSGIRYNSISGCSPIGSITVAPRSGTIPPVCEQVRPYLNLKLKGPGGSIYDVDPTTFSTTIIPPLAAGIYTYTLYDWDDASVPLSAFTVTVYRENPLVTATPTRTNNIYCLGSNVLLTSSVIDGINYQWYKNEVAIAGANSATYFINPLALSDAAKYKVSFTKNNCPYTTPDLTLGVDQQTVNFTTDKSYYCAGEVITLTGSAGNIPTTWQWTGSYLKASTIQQVATQNMPAGTYTYSLQAVDQYGCSATISKDILVRSLPSVVVSANNVCMANANTLGIPVTASPLGGSFSLLPSTPYTVSYSSGYILNGTNFHSGNYTLTYAYSDGYCTNAVATSFNVIGEIKDIIAFKDPYISGEGTSPYTADDPIYNSPSFKVCVYSISALSGYRNPIFDNSDLNFKVYGDVLDQIDPTDPEVGSRAKYTIYNSTSGKYLYNYFDLNNIQPWYFSTIYSDNTLGAVNNYTFRVEPYDDGKNCKNISMPFSVYYYLPCTYCDPYNNCITYAGRKEFEADTLGFADKATVSPNPSTNNFKVSLPDPKKLYTLKLFNSKGAEVLKRVLPSETTQWEFGNDLPVGMYLLSINNGTRVQTIKIVKE